MRLSPGHLRSSLLWTVMFTVAVLSGCGHWCFAGYSAPGNNGSPTEPTDGTTCASSHTGGTVQAVALKSSVCKGCDASSAVEHVFVTLRGIELHANTMNVPGDADWIEISPQLADQPRQMDLLGGLSSEILVENARVPAGYYREIKLQFFEEASANTEGLPRENACGNKGWNCVVHADGTVEALRWPSDALELVIPLESMHGNAMVVLPDANTYLELKLKLRPEFLFSSAEGWRVQNVLVGSANTSQPQSLEVANSTPE